MYISEFVCGIVIGIVSTVVLEIVALCHIAKEEFKNVK